MGTYVTDLLGSTAGVEEAIFKDGRSVQTDFVLISTGIRPNLELIQETNLNYNKGILVNRFLQTNDPSIYAIGECIEYQGKTWGLVAPVYEQARSLAGILAGNNLEYKESPLPPTRLKSEIPVITMGRLEEDVECEVVSYTDPNTLIYKKLVMKDNKLIGVNLVGEDLNVDNISLHYTAKLPLPERRADLLFPGSKEGEEILDAASWPDDLRICDCNGISAGEIRKVIRAGNDTLYKVVNVSRAGTGCGNCKNKVKAILVDQVGELKEDPAEKYYVPGIPKTREELSEFILSGNLRSVSSVFSAIPESVNDVKTQMGLDFLLSYIWKNNYEVEKSARFVNDRYYANIQKDGRFSVIPQIPGGVSYPEQIKAIADVATEYGAKIKITGSDRIAIFSIEKKDLKNVWKKLNSISGHAYSKTFRAVKSCVGTEFCRWGVGDSLSLGEIMGNRYSGTTGPAKFKMGVSGCPRNCSEALVKDFGVVAVEGGWDVYVGGNGGSKTKVAIKLSRFKTKEEVIQICDRFFEYYRKTAKFGERTAVFLERVGIESVRDVVLYDTEENLNKLESDFQEMLDHYQNPWSQEDDLNNEIIINAKSEDNWIELCFLEDIPRGSSGVFKTRFGEFALFHTIDSRWVACESRCPHQNGPIVDCHYGDGKLVCPIHQYTFDIFSGKCSNDEVNPLNIYPLKVAGGKVLILLSNRKE